MKTNFDVTDLFDTIVQAWVDSSEDIDEIIEESTDEFLMAVKLKCEEKIRKVVLEKMLAAEVLECL